MEETIEHLLLHYPKVRVAMGPLFGHRNLGPSHSPLEGPFFLGMAPFRAISGKRHGWQLDCVCFGLSGAKGTRLLFIIKLYRSIE